jgi:hypothetical protein
MLKITFLGEIMMLSFDKGFRGLVETAESAAAVSLKPLNMLQRSH